MRAQLASKAGNLDEYLASLGTHVEVGFNSTAQIARVGALTQKTNQFNLTTRRYSESEFRRERPIRPGGSSGVPPATDSRTKESLAPLLCMRRELSGRSITFLMSCRVLGRGVEKSILSAVCSQAEVEGAEAIRGEVHQDPQNGQTEEFYGTCGFEVEERKPDHSLWRLTLPVPASLKPAWIELKTA